MGQRDNWRPVWVDIRDFIVPGRGFFDEVPNQGQRHDTNILESTPGLSARVLAAGMMSGLTSPSRPWFRLGTHDPDLAQVIGVRIWLEQVERRMRAVMNNSNFYNALHSSYYELGSFGTGPIIILADYENVIRCRALTCGEYALGTSSALRVDTMYRSIWMTARQMVQEFGAPACSYSVQEAAKNKGETWFEVFHAIEPNDERIPGMEGAANSPWRSVYWEAKAGDKTDQFLRVSGFSSCPVMAPRWDTKGSDTYGQGPGWLALPDCKMLMRLQEDKLVAVDKIVNPPIVAPSSLKNQGLVNALPGGVTYFDTTAGNAVPVQPLYRVDLNLQALQEVVNETKFSIQSGFFVDLFLMMVRSDRRDMTAREVAERHQEKLLMLGPVLDRLQNELLDPAIDRIFEIMLEAGLIPPPPPEIEGESLKVEYISILATAQKMVGTASLEQLSAYAGSIVGVKPDVLDTLDWDALVREYADALGVPPSVVVPDEVVAKIRAARLAQQEQMAKEQRMLAAAQGAKTLSETDTGGNNALAALVGSVAPKA
jgi:hypothetical protein